MRTIHLPLAALLMAPLVATAAPPLHLQKGEWAYHAVTTVTSGPMSGHTVQRDWKECVQHANRPPDVAAHLNNGDMHCTAPTLSQGRAGYRTTLSCTTQTHGMTLKMHQDFTLKPAADGASVHVDGTMNETITGAPVAMPATQLHMTVTGKRTGACSG